MCIQLSVSRCFIFVILFLSSLCNFAQNKHEQKQLSISNLPIVLINTLGNPINRDSMVTAHMGIIDNGYGGVNHINDSMNGYNGFIGIRYRGHSSYTHAPKKSYRIETRDASGSDINVSLLGMPEEDDWALIANYTDKTLLRNTLSYTLAAQMGYWAPRSKYCELVVDNDYVGVFSLTETIKRDNNRVPVKKTDITNISGDALTGGYIIKIDKFNEPAEIAWTSPFMPLHHPDNQQIHFQIHYPAQGNLAPQQKDYIKAFTDSFEYALNSPQFNHPTQGYYPFVDLQSFVNYFVIQEFTKNVDAYRLSTFLYKDRDSEGGVLTMGPVWDFDLAFRNAEYCLNYEHTGWAYHYGQICPDDMFQPPFWWHRLLSDTLFVNKLKCDWLDYRNDILDTTHIFSHIDSIHAYINQAQSRNFTRWPIIGQYVWPNPQPIPQSYQAEIEALKKWIRNRLEWLDNNMPGVCNNTSARNLHTTLFPSIYPVPSSGIVFIDLPGKEQFFTYEVYDMRGVCMLKGTLKFAEEESTQLEMPLSKGIYILRIQTEKSLTAHKIIINH